MPSRPCLLFAAAAVVAVSPAQAQTPPAAAKPAAKAKAPPPKTAPKTVDTVTVTGESQNAYRSSIDRKSYGIANDLATTTGSISDALRNVPSVEVDVQGNVSLRGDSNVTIMIDGKPSNLFKGPGGAQALQSLSADQFERVEVITNPSAQFSADGSAGIINLISKQTRKAGVSGSLRANLGSAGRRNFGAGAAYNSNRLTLTGDASWRLDPQHSVQTETRQALDPVTRRTTNSVSLGTNRGPLHVTSLRAGADLDLDKASRVSGELRYNAFIFHPNVLNAFSAADAATGAPVEQFGLTGQVRTDRETGSAGVNFRRKFAGDDHLLTGSANFEHTDERNDQRITTRFAAPAGAPDEFRAIRGRNGLDFSELKADYNRPMPREGRLKAGYYFRQEDNDYDNRGLIGTGAATAVNDPGQTNRFHYRLRLNAGYATYEQPFGEQPFGDWTVLAGLRLEDVHLDLDQLTSHQANRQAYTRLYPSLHLADRLSETQQLTLSYSERVLRPGPQDLNAFRFVGQINARQGNPDLKPQITHSYEAGWQYRDGGTVYGATLYYRRNERGVTDVVADIGGGVLLTTKANLAESRNAGLELIANGRLTKALSYNVSANLFWNEIDASHAPLGPALGFGEKRSMVAEGGRASLNWQATAKDLFQVNVQMNVKRLLPQGFQEPMTLVFLGYRHKFSDALSAVVTVQDPTDSYHQVRVIDTPLLHVHTADKGRIQAVFFGLTYNFGAARRRPETFDFGQAPG